MGLLDFVTKKADDRGSEIAREIKSLQVRKETTISVADKEMNQLKQQKRMLFEKIGESAYETHKSGTSIDDSFFKDNWNALDELEQELDSKQKKLEENLARYDEEINTLSKEMDYYANAGGSQQAQAVQATNDFSADNSVNGADFPGGRCFCPNCGNEIYVTDKFCEKCGNKINI